MGEIFHTRWDIFERALLFPYLQIELSLSNFLKA
jgi:hypothetical protein